MDFTTIFGFNQFIIFVVFPSFLAFYLFFDSCVRL